MPPRPRSAIAPAAACVSRTSAITLSLISRDLGVDVERVERTEGAEARVVDEDVDGADARLDRRELRGVGEIGREHLGTARRCALDLLGQRLEPRASRATSTTSLPRSASWRANCSPMPTDAPVINATGICSWSRPIASTT